MARATCRFLEGGRQILAIASTARVATGRHSGTHTLIPGQSRAAVATIVRDGYWLLNRLANWAMIPALSVSASVRIWLWTES